MALMHIHMTLCYQCLVRGPDGVYKEGFREERNPKTGMMEWRYELWRYGAPCNEEPLVLHLIFPEPWPEYAQVHANTMPPWWLPPQNGAELMALWDEKPVEPLPFEARQSAPPPAMGLAAE